MNICFFFFFFFFFFFNRKLIAQSFIIAVLFPNSTEFVDEHYLVEITPSPPTFALMWTLTHAWNLAWLIYVVSIAIRSSNYGSLCVLPGHVSVLMFPFFIAACLADSLWLVLRNHFMLSPSLAVLCLSTACAMGACIIAHRQLSRTGLQLLTMKSGPEIWWTRILLLNGLALYFAWLATLTIINACIVMTYVFGISQSIATTYGLCATAVLATVCAVSDCYYLDRFTRYTLSPYLAVIVTLSGILSRHILLKNNNTVLNVCMLCCFAVFFVVRVIVMVTRHRSKAIFRDISMVQKGARRNYGSNEFMSITVA
ncbi:hypothetical protein CAPTEDRAFT_134815 [Capitella teleta]|uniref:Uncharacterized protein n=1 Tax=Capitella teleta TaxID=283909 RepID=R7U9R9_CAPTE|nr:hypothetical protein CAPTEDRAFT_134815 [Capitella teleta]|eukprot:ELU00553.1 hypothetical protein CAPTEDRAFT_134815 [Capitella teleta]